jgi:predicted phosphoribosyltransferase
MKSVGPRRRRPAGVNARRYHAAPKRAPGLDIPAWEWKNVADLTFADRVDAARRLHAFMTGFDHAEDVIVVGIPHGGVVVAAELARLMECPLAVWVAQKLHAPNAPSLSLGALGEDGELILHEETLRQYKIRPGYLVEEVRLQRKAVARRAAAFREEQTLDQVQGRRVIVVDDGLATGATLRSTLKGVGHFKPSSITVAVPVATQRLAHELKEDGYVVHTLTQPLTVRDLRHFYRSFPEVTDEEVMIALGRALPVEAPVETEA